jgi:hypothetical protein
MDRQQGILSTKILKSNFKNKKTTRRYALLTVRNTLLYNNLIKSDKSKSSNAYKHINMLIYPAPNFSKILV